MNKELIAEAVRIINEYLLTPVIYYLDCGYKVDFVCFLETGIDEDEMYMIEEKITQKTGVASQVIDIREFEPCDAEEIINNGELVYSQSSVMEALFKSAVMTEVELQNKRKEIFIERKNSTKTLYVQ